MINVVLFTSGDASLIELKCRNYKKYFQNVDLFTVICYPYGGTLMETQGGQFTPRSKVNMEEFDKILSNVESTFKKYGLKHKLISDISAIGSLHTSIINRYKNLLLDQSYNVIYIDEEDAFLLGDYFESFCNEIIDDKYKLIGGIKDSLVIGEYLDKWNRKYNLNHKYPLSTLHFPQIYNPSIYESIDFNSTGIAAYIDEFVDVKKEWGFNNCDNEIELDGTERIISDFRYESSSICYAKHLDTFQYNNFQTYKFEDKVKFIKSFEWDLGYFFVTCDDLESELEICKFNIEYNPILCHFRNAYTYSEPNFGKIFSDIDWFLVKRHATLPKYKHVLNLMYNFIDVYGCLYDENYKHNINWYLTENNLKSSSKIYLEILNKII